MNDDDFKLILQALAQLSALIVAVYILILLEDGTDFFEILSILFYYFISVFLIVILVMIIKGILQWKQRKNIKKQELQKQQHQIEILNLQTKLRRLEIQQKKNVQFLKPTGKLGVNKSKA